MREAVIWQAEIDVWRPHLFPVEHWPYHTHFEAFDDPTWAPTLLEAWGELQETLRSVCEGIANDALARSGARTGITERSGCRRTMCNPKVLIGRGYAEDES